MALARPGFWQTHKHNRNYGMQWHEFPTYRELKKVLLQSIKDDVEEEITVIRFRRGEWGEWWEKWIESNGKLKKISEGWS